MAVFETLLAFLGLAQSTSQYSEQRRLQGAALIANVETNTRSAALLAESEISRLSGKVEGQLSSRENLIGPLLEVRLQCDQILALVEENRKLLRDKGADEQVLMELESWSANSSLLRPHVEQMVKQIESSLRS